MNIFFAIWTGAVGGLVTALIVLLIGQYWSAVFLPWFEDRVYRGARIDGKWKSEWPFKGETRTEYAILKQKAHEIRGEISYPQDSEGRSHVYELTGSLYDNYFTATTHELGVSRVERGAIVLVVRPGGSVPEMRGLAIWFDDDKNSPTQVENRWTKAE